MKDDESGFLRRCISPVLPGRGIDWVLNTLPPEAETGNFVAHRRGVPVLVHAAQLARTRCHRNAASSGRPWRDRVATDDELECATRSTAGSSAPFD